MLVRMGAHPLPEARECTARILSELRKVIPAFLTASTEDRGRAHERYLRRSEHAAQRDRRPRAARARRCPGRAAGAARRLRPRRRGTRCWPTRSGPPGAAAWPRPGRGPPSSTQASARALAAWAGDRSDRRQRPGRALEATTYAFEIVCDYGAYRDLQRHRMLTLQAQPLTPRLGYDMRLEVAEEREAATPAAARRQRPGSGDLASRAAGPRKRHAAPHPPQVSADAREGACAWSAPRRPQRGSCRRGRPRGHRPNRRGRGCTAIAAMTDLRRPQRPGRGAPGGGVAVGSAPGARVSRTRRRASSGSPYEDATGFSRAVRVGGRVLVSGTAPVWPDGSCDPDPAAQARRCLEIVAAALESLGAGLGTSSTRGCSSWTPPAQRR